MTVPQIKLHDGTSIPQLGFGVFQVPPEETAATVAQAFEAGYRHIDTAQMYENEAGVGAAIKASGLSRDDLYITTKLNNGFHRPDDARRAIDESLERLGLDQADLFLIHWPLPTQYDGDFVSTWQALSRPSRPGRPARSASPTSSPPTSTGSSRRPASCRSSTRSRCTRSSPTRTCARPTQRHGVLTEAWSPIAQGKVNEDDTIAEIASTASAVRRPRSPCAGTCSAATSSSPSR